MFILTPNVQTERVSIQDLHALIFQHFQPLRLEAVFLANNFYLQPPTDNHHSQHYYLLKSNMGAGASSTAVENCRSTVAGLLLNKPEDASDITVSSFVLFV